MDLHFASVWETIADKQPDRTALISGRQSRTWREFDERAARIAGLLETHDIGVGQKIGIYLHNSNEYMETQFGAFKARACPINVNYRYKADELVYLLDNADCEALFFQSSYAMRIWEIRKKLPKVKLFVQIDDNTPEGLLAEAVDYERAIRGASPQERIGRSSDDVYMLYTGGTTGLPKGVMYTQGQFVRAMSSAIRDYGLSLPKKTEDITAIVNRLEELDVTPRTLSACPLMHGTGMWLGAMTPLVQGGSCVTISKLGLDAHRLWGEVENHGVSHIVIVGDAFARPMLEALREAETSGRMYDLSSLKQINSSGVMWSQEVKTALLEFHDMRLVDTMGSSEGGMGSSVSQRGDAAITARFQLQKGVKVLADDGTEVRPGSGAVGKLATPGLVPLGYYKDPVKSAETFVEIEGKRYSVPGDYARVEPDGSIILLGRGSNCINTAGEKVYPEEVEEAIKKHDDIVDCLVVGVSDERFGQRIVAVAASSATLEEETLIDFAHTHLAGYKVPKTIVFVDGVRRAPNGKADYKWAQQTAEASVNG